MTWPNQNLKKSPIIPKVYNVDTKEGDAHQVT